MDTLLVQSRDKNLYFVCHNRKHKMFHLQQDSDFEKTSGNIYDQGKQGFALHPFSCEGVEESHAKRYQNV